MRVNRSGSCYQSQSRIETVGCEGTRGCCGDQYASSELILRPTRSARLSFSLFFFAVAALFLGLGIRDWIARGSDLWFSAVFALTLVAVGVIAWSASIQADDTTIAVRFGLTRRYDRRRLAAIPDWRGVNLPI